MLRMSTTPIIRSTQNCNYSLRYSAATFLQRGQAWPRWREVAAQKIWPVPEAVVTVLCTPDDGCGWHPKHVEWTCRVINRLLCVASCWTIINMQLINWLNKQHLICQYPGSITGCPRKACSLCNETALLGEMTDRTTCSFTCATDKLRSPNKWCR